MDSLIVPSSNLRSIVFENLLRNAAVHTSYDCAVLIEYTTSDDKMRIRISDNGEVIANEAK